MLEEILRIIKIDDKYISRRITESYFKKNYLELYEKIMNWKSNDLLFSEKLYMIVNNINEPPNCIICGKELKFRKFSNGYANYCSMKCMGSDDSIKQKKINNSLERYGVKHPSELDSFKNKRKKTNLERFGVEYPIIILELNLMVYIGIQNFLKIKIII